MVFAAPCTVPLPGVRVTRQLLSGSRCRSSDRPAGGQRCRALTRARGVSRSLSAQKARRCASLVRWTTPGAPQGQPAGG